MARRLAVLSLFTATILGVATVALPNRAAFAQTGAMDARGEAQAKEALTLYKQGLYEEAAKMFAKLSVEYPDMPVFERNLGACFYYLRKPGPAISNLRNYLLRKKDIAPDDRQVVERWIAEMERLRDQESAKKPPSSALPGQSAVAPAAAPAPAMEAQALPPPVATPYPATPYPATPYPATAYPAEPYPATAYPAAPYPTTPYPATAYPAAPYPATAYPATPYPMAAPQAAPPPQAQYQPLAPTPVAGPPAPAAAPPATPAALDLSNQARPSEVQDQGSPFYKTWWFWTGVVVVAGGAVTAYWLATRGGSENACSGGSIPCDAIK